MRDINVAVIGCGGIANGKHLPSLQELPFVHIVAFCDIIEERAVKACGQYGAEGARVYTDYKQLLEQEKDIEAVHVLTPNISHSEISVAALDRGLHVLCEKPMAKDVAGARAMVEAAKRNNRILTIGYQSRQRANSRYLKAEVEAGTLGDIYYAEALALRRRAVPTWGVFLDEEKQGGGPLIDIGTHALDLTMWLMNNYEPQMVVGSVYRKLGDNENAANIFGSWDPKKFTVEDSAFGYIRFKNGATVVLKSSWALNILDYQEASCILCGDKAGADMKDGGLRINGEKHSKMYISEPDLSAGEVAFYEGTSDKPEVLEALNFYGAVLEGEELVVKPEQALKVTEILNAIYESAKSGQPVYFD